MGDRHAQMRDADSKSSMKQAAVLGGSASNSETRPEGEITGDCPCAPPALCPITATVGWTCGRALIPAPGPCAGYQIHQSSDFSDSLKLPFSVKSLDIVH